MLAYASIHFSASPSKWVLGYARTTFVVLLALFAAAAIARGNPSTMVFAALPPEAQQTIRLIRAGGPFPYERDGVVFGNRERLLPSQKRGYYREYTVPTPGVRSRGARRIVAGAGGELYYTDDHYRTFRRIVE